MSGKQVSSTGWKMVGVGAALALMLAACSPATAAPTIAPPLSTLAPTEIIGLPTEAATSALEATEAATPAATDVGAIGTEAATQPAVTEIAGTQPAGTQTANEPLLIESGQLVGMAVQDSTGASLGQISDVLVDISGTVRGVVLNLGAAGAPAATEAATESATTAATEAATSVATEAATSVATDVATPAATEAAPSTTQTASNAVIVPWSSIMADPATKTLVYQGSSSELAALPAYDAATFDAGYVLRAQDTNLPAEYDGLIRLGSQLNDVNLETPANDKLGAVQNVILDLGSGQATYAALDVSTFLGLTNDVVLVPWNKLTLDSSDASSMTPVVRLDISKSALQSAPAFDPSTLSFWPTPAEPSWDNEIKLYWLTAG